MCGKKKTDIRDLIDKYRLAPHPEGGYYRELYRSDLSAYRIHRLDPRKGAHFVVILAGYWQAARSTGGYSLVSCVVGPGFDFSDFRLLTDEPEIQRGVLTRFPEAKGFC